MLGVNPSIVGPPWVFQLHSREIGNSGAFRRYSLCKVVCFVFQSQAGSQPEEDLVFCLTNLIEGHMYFSTESVRELENLISALEFGPVVPHISELSQEYIDSVEHLTEDDCIAIKPNYHFIVNALEDLE